MVKSTYIELLNVPEFLYKPRENYRPEQEAEMPAKIGLQPLLEAGELKVY